jgi:hypothetical protein
MFIEFSDAWALANWGANVEGWAVPTSMLYLQIIIIFNIGSLPSLGVVTVSNHHPVAPLYLCPYWDIAFPWLAMCVSFPISVLRTFFQ